MALVRLQGETRAERRGEQAGARGGADERELRDREAHAAGRCELLRDLRPDLPDAFFPESLFSTFLLP